MSDTEIQIDDIVQLSPETTGNKAFGACLMVVTDVYSWGVQGYVHALGQTIGSGKDAQTSVAYYRAETGTFFRTGGKAHWLVGAPGEEGEAPQ